MPEESVKSPRRKEFAASSSSSWSRAEEVMPPTLESKDLKNRKCRRRLCLPGPEFCLDLDQCFRTTLEVPFWENKGKAKLGSSLLPKSTSLRLCLVCCRFNYALHYSSTLENAWNLN